MLAHRTPLAKPRESVLHEMHGVEARPRPPAQSKESEEGKMKLNTVVRLPDGRIGTICYNHLDGAGGVWGRKTFQMPEGGFGDELPEPEFMLREKSLQPLADIGRVGAQGCECVGELYEIIEVPSDEPA